LKFRQIKIFFLVARDGKTKNAVYNKNRPQFVKKRPRSTEIEWVEREETKKKEKLS